MEELKALEAPLTPRQQYEQRKAEDIARDPDMAELYRRSEAFGGARISRTRQAKKDIMRQNKLSGRQFVRARKAAKRAMKEIVRRAKAAEMDRSLGDIIS